MTDGQNGRTPVQDDTFINDLRKRADEIKTEAGYDGKLDVKLLRQLEPLLYTAIPARFIEHTPKRQNRNEPGLPYDVTGMRSTQVQVDMMNAVLGLTHWRMLTHYRDNGTVCKTVVIVGNDLHFAGLDENGVMAPAILSGDGRTAHIAEILAERSGWGGHTRGSGPGDIWKGAETNSAKRTLARFGPGHEVYSGDYEDDPTRPEFQQRRRDTQPQTRAQEDLPDITDEQAQEALGKWAETEELVKLEGEDDPVELGPLIKEAREALEAVGDVPVRQVYALIGRRREDVVGLRELIKRARNATTMKPEGSGATAS